MNQTMVKWKVVLKNKEPVEKIQTVKSRRKYKKHKNYPKFLRLQKQKRKILMSWILKDSEWVQPQKNFKEKSLTTEDIKTSSKKGW